VPTRVLGWPAFNPGTGNPYNALLYGALERRGAHVDEFSAARLLRERYDVWHIHWPERLAHGRAALARLLSFAALVLVARARGTRIVWTVHNLEGHAACRPGLERQLMRWLARRLDGIVALSETGALLVRERYPMLARRPTAVVSHGHYIGRYSNEVDRAEARTLLQLADADRVVVFAGRIDPYKGIERLVREFARLENPQARLVVAGRPASQELRLAIEEAAGADGRIRLHLTDLCDDELQVFLNAADLVALPYERILNSGTALLALSFGRPVLVPGTGAMEDLRAQLGDDAVRLFSGPLSAEQLAAALAAPAPDPDVLLSRVRAEHDWDAIAEQTLSLYAEASR
jgi:beta-1,4-mannosyltransferase